MDILKVHTRGKPLAKKVDLEVLARGYTWIHSLQILKTSLTEAALLTARNQKRRIGMQELEEAVHRVVAGPRKKSRLISEHEKKVIAYHESGHALVALMLPNTDPVHEVSIIPRGAALGYTLRGCLWKISILSQNQKFWTKLHQCLLVGGGRGDNL